MRRWPRSPLSVFLALTLWAASDPPGWAGEIPTVPVLRIETGMHGSAINRIALSQADQQLITVSDDKTVRLWSLVDGQPLDVLRGPIGEGGPEGALYAVALSPSGKTIAVGGHTGLSWDGSASLYLFSREHRDAGPWLGRIALGGVPADAVNSLAFSPDGKYVAVGTNDGKGLRIVDLGGRKVDIVDPGYGDAISSVRFAPDGRLVTASLDGAVRLYDPQFKRIRTYKAPAGARPWSVAFNQSGFSIAVGFLGAAKVVVLGGNDLKPMAEFKGGEKRQGSLSVVAWAPDGRQLYGAGTYGDGSGRKLIRRWSLGDGKALEIEAGDDTVTDLQPAADGRIVFATAEPSWGVIATDGTRSQQQGRGQADFRDVALRVSADGAVVDFAFERGGARPARFDLLNGVEAAPAPRADLKPPAEAVGGSTIVDWRNNQKPLLDGKLLALDENEYSRSATLTGDGSGALVGTDYFLRFYKATQLVWRTALPAAAWAANVSGDGRVAVAGLGDGTIRWYRIADGAELLSLYVHPDGARWVLWTPEGFFDHAPQGQTLVGYHLNLVEQARPRGGVFVNVEQLYGLFYRRDLVVKKFHGNAEREIAEQLAAIGDVRTVLGRGLPPIMRLTEFCTRLRGADQCMPVGAEARLRGGSKLQPVTAEAPRVVLRFEVEDQGGGNGPVVLRRQGAPVAAVGTTRSVVGKVRQEERTVEIQRGLNLISLSGFNAAREIELDSKDRPTLAIRYEAPPEKPVLRVLSVGVDRLPQSSIPPLANAANDAAGIVENLKADRRKLVFSEVDAVLLTNENATLSAITEAFAGLAKRAQSDDVAIVFLAGHGVPLDGKYYFLPYDFPGLSPESLRSASLTHRKLADALSALPTARTLVILDTCFSGTFAVNDSLTRDSRDQTAGKQMSHASGRFILAASSSQEEALDGINGHGVLTDVLLKGLSGDADRQVRGDRDGKVSVMELGEFARAKVPELAVKVGKGHSQKPRWFFNGDDLFDVRSVDER